MPVQNISFPYTTDAISKKQFEAHLALYQGYVESLHKITGEYNNAPMRDKANATCSKYRCLKKGEAFALNGIILHELYFQNLGKAGGSPGAKTREILNGAFGSVKAFQEDLTACAKSARGWVVFAYDQRSQSYGCFLQDAHDDGVITLSFPLLVLDMYEHAYFLDYATDKAAYIKRFMDCIQWDEVEKRCRYLLSASV